MLKSKKFIIISVIAAVLLIGGVAGVALAQTGDAQDETAGKSLLGRVATILNLDEQTVEDAFKKASREMADEGLEAKLKALVEKGVITQAQADEYKTWWQDRPETVAPGFRGMPRFGGRGFGFRMPCFPLAQEKLAAVAQ